MKASLEQADDGFCSWASNSVSTKVKDWYSATKDILIVSLYLSTAQQWIAADLIKNKRTNTLGWRHTEDKVPLVVIQKQEKTKIKMENKRNIQQQ